jgi:hypothetical protein
VKINDILVENRSYLYEGLSTADVNSVKLWETAGHKIYEAALTADQIQQIFQQVEQGATAAGGNRTLIGQGKDVATAVKKAYDDLASKVQNSGPMQNVDQLYAQAAEKLKQATGGDAGAMQYVQKYRDFAKKHPVAQSLIYSALIAAAGISGAGLGGAAALGLFKMVDKLLQGEKFSTAVGKGLETGALAYGAGQIGKAFQGGEKVTSTTTTDTGVVDMPGNPALNQAMASGQVAQNWVAQDPRYADTIKQIMSSQDKSPEWKAAFGQYLARNAGALNSSSQPGMISNAIQTAAKLADTQVRESINLTKYIDRQSTVRMWALKESLNRPRGGMQLTEAGVTKLFSLVEALNTNTGTPNPTPPEPPPEDTQDPSWTGRKEAPPAEPASTPATPDPGAGAFGQMTNQLANTGTSSTGGQTQGTATGLTHTANPTNPNQPPATNAAPAAPTAAPAKKGILGKAADWVKTKGANLTNKVTADKLNTAWKKAGSPMDSDKLAQILQSAGVDQPVIDQAYAGLKIPAPAAVPTDATNADPAQSNNQAPADNSYDDAENLKLAADILPMWKKFASQYLAGYGNSPENLKKAAQAFAAKNYPEAGKQALQSGISSVTNAKSADVYVARMANLALVNHKAGINPDQTDQSSQPADTTQDASTDSGLVDQYGNPLKKTAADASASATQTTAPGPDAHDEKDINHDMVPGMEIIQKEPIIVKYKNREFGLDDNGQWVHLGGTKTPHQSFQAMLDKAAGFSESFDPGQMLWNKLNK